MQNQKSARASKINQAAQFVQFMIKQAYACLFGLLFLSAIILSTLIWHDDWVLKRYDALVIFAVATQILLIAFKLETLHEAKVIFLFHIAGTVMEIFKINAGSWSYPEPGVAKIAGVPLFTGFMYASVGSYIARAIRIFDLRFAPYPSIWITGLLAAAIYINFFAHHYTYDIRLVLFAATLIIFWRTFIYIQNQNVSHKRFVRLPIAVFCGAFCLWVAENIGTMTGTWAYAGQSAFELVRFGKLGSWYLLLYLSFFLVTLIYRDMLFKQPLINDLAKQDKLG